MNTNTNTTAIASVTKTIASVGAKKPSTKKGINTVVALGDDVAKGLMLDFAKGYTIATSGLNACNIVIQKLIDSGVKFVKLSEKSKKDTLEFKFTDTCKKELFASFDSLGKYSKGYLENVWKAFSNAVNKKQLLTDLNPNRKNKGKTAPKDKTAEQLKTDMNKALLTIWELSEAVPNAMEYIQNKIDNDGLDLIEAITDYLESEGTVLEK
jgi:hypothetical protein